ncbi:echinoderm microtubule-associated protein-like 2 isoform X1 [Patella vulgata]|uniref:echinoderm microtubule-associated protein-like 2 isoform X1 n=2 Tax=Patella vulgata TaxID=6465 RepID=UPI00217FC98E|nr:echinoderm microtubule-associated protein-like 2 isoform X1 [Patella vulgata]
MKGHVLIFNGKCGAFHVQIMKNLRNDDSVKNQNDFENVSRQRLRSIHMSLRRYGNVESRINLKDLQHAFEENQVALTQRHYQMITDTCEDHFGIDFEKLYKLLIQAQEDRNQMLAPKNDQRIVLTREQRDQDLLYRLEEQLVKRQVFFDIDAIRQAFQNKDTNRIGKVQKDQAQLIFAHLKTPLYGALLTNLLNRCHAENDGGISWPEFINFLERSQQRAWEKHPAMSELPKQVQDEEMVNPDVIDELSSSAKAKVVSKLLKKASMQRERSALAKPKTTEEKEEVNVIPRSSNKVMEKEQLNDNLANINKTITPRPHVADQTCQRQEDIIEQNEESGLTNQEHQENYVKSTDQTKVTLQIKGKLVKVMKPCGYDFQNVPIDPPTERLHLEWVYGYRGNDCRNNIYLLANGEIIYFMANIVILYNREAHSQRHYIEHTEQIKSIAVHSDGIIIASGQQSSKTRPNHTAIVHVWRADDLQNLFVLGENYFQKAVVCLTFQHNCDLLAVVDHGDSKKLSMWDTEQGKMIADTLIDTDVMCDISCNPRMPEVFVTAGKEHLFWWKVNEATNKIVSYAQANYEAYLRARFVICASHTSKGDLITGDSNGTIYVWGNCGNKITNFVKHGHEGPVFSLYVMKHHLLSGGRDGIIYAWEWSKNMDCAGKVEVAKTEGGIRMIQIIDKTLLIGTTMNSMLASTISINGSPLENSELDPLPITQGHFDDLRGLCEIQRSFMGANFLTTGTDGIICKFNAFTHEPAWKLVMKGSTFLCADCSTNGKLLCLGTMEGYLMIMEINSETFTVTELLHRKIAKDRLDCIAFSPDHNCVAVGGFEKSITIFACMEKEDGTQSWQCVGKCWGHKGYITAVDWAAEKIGDVYFLRSSSSYPEQMYWNTSTCEKVDYKDVSDVAWKSQQCTLDYNLIGIWCSKQVQEVAVNNVSVNPTKTLVAVSDTQGNLSLFRYPCNKDSVYCHTYKSLLNTQKVSFSSNGKHVIVVGGQDSCVTQWTVVGTEI